jgi:hypothetical protein
MAGRRADAVLHHQELVGCQLGEQSYIRMIRDKDDQGRIATRDDPRATATTPDWSFSFLCLCPSWDDSLKSLICSTASASDTIERSKKLGYLLFRSGHPGVVHLSLSASLASGPQAIAKLKQVNLRSGDPSQNRVSA